jgi:prepilin-type processing-associated H-X9-DG protein
MTTSSTPDKTVPPRAAHEQTFQFRIRDLLLIMLLVALAAGAIAQASGLLFLLLLVTSGCCAYLWRKLWLPVQFMHVLCGLMIFGLGVALLVPPMCSIPRSLSRRMSCQNNLKLITIALHNYHDTYGCFPPAYIADKTGRPMHSWRVLILPFMEQENLYQQYRLDEPWDGPNNRKLADEIISVYSCPGEPAKPITETSYVAIIGPHTAWPGEKARSLQEFADGSGNVLLVVEVHDSGIHWMEPRDLHVTQMAPTINAVHGQGISSSHPQGANAAYADGSVRYLHESLPADVLQTWIHVDDGTLPEPPP